MKLHWRSLTSHAPLIIAVIFGSAAAPSRAIAECGTYIVYTDPAHRAADEQAMGEHQSPVPCHGPRCSQAPSPAPMPPAPLNLRILADDPLVVSAAECLIPPTIESYPSNAIDGDVVRRLTDIFHPPR